MKKIDANCIEAYKDEIRRLSPNHPVYGVVYRAFERQGYDISNLTKPNTDSPPTEQDWDEAIVIMTDGEVTPDTTTDFNFYRAVYTSGLYPEEESNRKFEKKVGIPRRLPKLWPI